MRYDAIVMGVSSGGLNALKMILSVLPGNFSIPIIIVQHVSPHSDNKWIELLNNKSELYIKEADEKEKIETGKVYIAPPNYHLLIEKDRTFSLTIDARVNYSRPSIDVLFESAAETYQANLVGVILTGANNDGTAGLQRIKEFGGLVIVQDPATAESHCMPASAIAGVAVDHIADIEGIVGLLLKIAGN